MKNKTFTALMLGASLALIPSAVFAQTAPTAQNMEAHGVPQDNAGPNHFTMADKHFIKAAAEGGMAEVKLGQLAADKGGTDAVKDFGSKMVKDHSALNDAMKPFVEQAGMTAPTSLNAKDQALYDRLNGLHGAAFDSAYTSAMLKDHMKDKADFDKEAASTKNEAFRDALKQGDQTITMHLAMVKKLSSTHGKSDEAGS